MVTALVALGAALIGGAATYLANESTKDQLDAMADQAANELNTTRDQVYKTLGFNSSTGQFDDFNKLEAVMVQAPAFDMDANGINDVNQFQTGEFEGITGQDLYEDPSFKYRQDMANEALMAELGGLGLIDSGAAAYELANLNQNMASQEYQNVYDRSLSKYNANMNANSQNFMQSYNIWNAKLNNEIANANRQLQADGVNMSAEEARRLAVANAQMGIGSDLTSLNAQVANTKAMLPNPVTQGLQSGIGAGLAAASFNAGAGNAVSTTASTGGTNAGNFVGSTNGLSNSLSMPKYNGVH
jgi:hypothetical protein